MANAAGDGAILTNISFQLLPGEVIAVVGPSGAGKSTLLRMLAGAGRPDRGIIRIDHASMLDWDPERLAEYIGFLPQDVSLFAGTVKENIARFQDGSDAEIGEIDAKAIAAAKCCQAHELILGLPNGYDSMLGWGGRGLSAGQAQRIGLARALYGDPPIVLLDEPNAHLDAAGEGQLVETLVALKARKAGVYDRCSSHGRAGRGRQDSRPSRRTDRSIWRARRNHRPAQPAPRPRPSKRRREQMCGKKRHERVSCTAAAANLLWSRVTRRLRRDGHAIDDVHSEVRLGIIVAGLFFVLFLGWAAFAPLDSAAYATGQLVVSGQRQSVQHRDGGVVAAIKVAEGRHVRKGDTLIELAGAEVRAQERALAAQMVNFQAQRARLEAELSGGAIMLAGGIHHCDGIKARRDRRGNSGPVERISGPAVAAFRSVPGAGPAVGASE